MGENLNCGGERVESQCEDSGTRVKEMTARKGQKRPREDDPPAGITTEPPAAGPGENDSLPSKKTAPPALIKCDICLCEMSSDLVLNSHINGSRHKKRMKALEIVANLKAAGEKGIDLKPKNGSNSYRCDICSLTVNSPQQLEIHLAGAKHKTRMSKEKLLNVVINVTTTNNQAKSIRNTDNPPLKKRKKDCKFLFCDVCNVTLNSETQYEQHVLSKKHLGRTKGESNRKKRGNRLENQTNLVQNFPGGHQFSKEPDKDNSHNDSPTQQFQPNANRIHQVHSLQSNRTNMDLSQMSRSGMSNCPPFGSYFQSQRPFVNNHRNFGTGFGRIAETGKPFSKGRTHLFNSHPDSALQAASSKS